MADNRWYGVVLGIVALTTIVGVIFSPMTWPTTVGLGALITISVLTLRAAAFAEAKAEALRRKQEIVDARVLDIQRTGNDTHLLVNSAYGALLRNHLVALESVARLTVNQDDKAAAAADVEAARDAYQNHMTEQAKVDANMTRRT